MTNPEVDAYYAGRKAFKQGTENPYHFYEQKDLWVSFRDGWDDAQQDYIEIGHDEDEHLHEQEDT